MPNIVEEKTIVPSSIPQTQAILGAPVSLAKAPKPITTVQPVATAAKAPSVNKSFLNAIEALGLGDVFKAQQQQTLTDKIKDSSET
jgi:hypothetical protein